MTLCYNKKGFIGKMDLSEKKEFYKELFSLAIPISLQNLALAILIPDLLMRIYTPRTCPY